VNLKVLKLITVLFVTFFANSHLQGYRKAAIQKRGLLDSRTIQLVFTFNETSVCI